MVNLVVLYQRLTSQWLMVMKRITYTCIAAPYVDPLKKIKPYRCALINYDKEIEPAPTSNFKEGRRFGIADVARTLGITVSIIMIYETFIIDNQW